MNKLIVVLAICLTSSCVFADTSKTLTKTISLEDAKKLVFNVGVGRINVSPSADNKLHVTVKVENNDAFFSFFDDDIEDVALEINRFSNRIKLSVTEGDYAETWTVYVPQVEDLDINIGVGEVEVEDVAANLDIDNGVGEVRVSSLAEFFAEVDLDSGVGETRIKATSGNHSSRRDFVSSSQNWTGSGQYSINVDVGVGESRVTLD